MGKIGIFVKKHESIFTNGCVQQGYFVMKSLRKAGFEVTFTTIDKDYTQFELLNEPIINVLSLDQLMQYDTFIFSSLVINQLEFISYLKLLGIKVINQMVGNYFILNAEEFVFGHHTGVISTMVNKYIDEIWLMPMYENCIEYIASITGKPVKISPYVWDDEFIKKYINLKGITPQYLPPEENYQSKPLDIVIMEPNLSIHKNSLVPLLICNKFFIKNPNKLGQIYIISKPSHNDTWKESIKHLEIVKCNKITSFQRMISLEVFHSLRQKNSKYVVLSSNIRNGLNFLHLECFTLGIPIIHNCKPYAKNELYFDDNDIMIEINKAVGYMEQIHKKPYSIPAILPSIVNRYHPDNKINITGHKTLLNTMAKSPKTKIQELIPLLSYNDNLNVDKIDYGLVTYIDNRTNSNIVNKNLEFINLNINKRLTVNIYYSKDIDINEFTINKSKLRNLDIKLILLDEYNTSSAIKYYILGNSPFKTTVYFESNNILCFNFVDLSNKFTDEYIIASTKYENHLDKIDLQKYKNKPKDLKEQKDQNDSNEKIAYFELLKSLFKLLNIEYKKEEPIILDTNMMIVKSNKLKQLCRAIYTKYNGFNEMFGDMLMNFLILFSNTSIVNLSSTIKMIGRLENNNFTNYGYVNLLNGTILNIILDEKSDTTFNCLCDPVDLSTFTNDDNITIRTYGLTEVKSINI